MNSRVYFLAGPTNIVRELDFYIGIMCSAALFHIDILFQSTNTALKRV